VVTNHSRYTENDIKRAVKESDVQIYAVGNAYEPLSSRGRTPEEAGGPGLLANLSEVSGGRLSVWKDANELPDIRGERSPSNCATNTCWAISPQT